MNLAAGDAYVAGTPDIPPDMAVLLHKLEQDFAVHKTIDQWTYINRREEIMQLVSRSLQQHQALGLPSAAGQLHADLGVGQAPPPELEKILTPRARAEPGAPPEWLLLRLRARAVATPTDAAFLVLDSRGKLQQQISWEKLYHKAAKVAHELRSRGPFKAETSAALLYKQHEVCEFAVAFFGCFLAGVTAVPVHGDVALPEMFEILTATATLVVLVSESVLRELEKLGALPSGLQWPPKITRLRTSDLGLARRSELENITKLDGPNDLAYIEFSRLPVGELRGIALSHRTIAHQMLCLDATLLSLPDGGTLTIPPTKRGLRRVLLATIDVRILIGLIIGVMFAVHSGNILVWAPPSTMEVQGLYANILLKFHANLLLADFLGLKRVTYDYQKSPNATRFFLKTQRVDFSLVKWVLVNALTLDGEFLEVLSDRFLKPLGCTQARNAIIPMLTLSEYGGMVISMRDWLGRSDKWGPEIVGPAKTAASPGALSLVVLDQEGLAQNKVCVIDTNSLETDELVPGTLRVDAFGYPLPDATLAVVNPELCTVVVKGELGELWIDSPCLLGGIYGLKRESKLIFHAKCRAADGPLEMDFLRTGLLGFTYQGKVYVLGLYEDRIRQKTSWMNHKRNGTPLPPEIRYHYSSHLLATLANQVRNIYDCTIFDVYIGNEYLPVAIVEAAIARKVIDDLDTASTSSKAKGRYDYTCVPLNEPVLNAIAKKCFDVLNAHHQLRLYCIVVVDCDTLPKIMRSGGLEIASMLCKKKFLEGTLKSDFVKFFVKESFSAVPHGEDMIGGMWSPYASNLRSESLQKYPAQYTTIDPRPKTIDDKTGTPLSDFRTIIDVLKFRVSTAGDAIAFQNIDTSGKSSKPLTWKKFEQRIYAACQYIIEKTTLKPGQYVILMYSLSEEFAIILYACLMCGIVPIPMLPFDLNRIGEDFPAYVGVIKDFEVQDVFVNDDVERFMKSGPVADALKKLSHHRARPPRIKNTLKLSKVSNLANLQLKIIKYQADAKYGSKNATCLIWLHFTSDHYRIGATLSHANIINICKVFKETCNLSSKLSIVGCVRHSAGIGFVEAVLLGVYLGKTTYLSSPVNFAGNPLSFFLALARYKVKDVFVTEQMLKYAVSRFTPKGFNLTNLKNMMISTEGRVETDLLRKIANVFLPAKLSAASMSAVYTHCFNPIISTRLYMVVAPVDLYLDPVALRQGYISLVNQADHPNALRVQDSGMVPVCTQIAIVNPETRRICREGEFGEIWVHSEANVMSFTNGPKGPLDNFTTKQFMGKIEDGDPELTYLRTGDLGFLHHISITKNHRSEAEPEISMFQPLFVLGKISDTFEVLGLHHFPLDIESTIELCHSDIYKNGSCIFKCSDYTIVVCESRRTKSLLALVPLVVNTVFSKHHLTVDIVAFIKKGEFPISRLGTKQRARIVDAWVQGIIPLSVLYGVNYGENYMIQMIKEIDDVTKEHPFVQQRNAAQEYYDAAPDGFAADPLTLNWN